MTLSKPALSSLSTQLSSLLRQSQWHLDEAALVISHLDDPALDPDLYLHKLNQLALELDRRIPSKRNMGAVLPAFIEFMASENGFCGEESDYFNPQNVYLHQVIERRRGMPLSLSIIYMEVARRIGIPVQGIGLPGHFLIQVEGNPSYIDPFCHGERLNEAACRTRFHRIYGPDAHFDPRFLRPVTQKQMLARLINNLKGIYVRKPDPYITIQLIDLYLVIYPDASQEILERGLLYRELECFNPALRDFETYLGTLADDESTLEQRQKILQEIAALKRMTLSFH